MPCKAGLHSLTRVLLDPAPTVRPHSHLKTLWPWLAGQPRFLAKDVRLSRTLRSADELNTPYTNYVGTYTGALDYVFYEPGRMAGKGGVAACPSILGHSRWTSCEAAVSHTPSVLAHLSTCI